MLQPPSPNGVVDPRSAVSKRVLVDDLVGRHLVATGIGQLRIGSPGSSGHRIDLEVTPAGIEVTSPRALPYDRAASGLALWWSSGDARLELDTQLVEDGDDLRLVTSWPPRRVQHRQHRRVRLEAPLWIHLLGTDRMLEATTSNISVGGLAFTMPDWPSASRVEIGADVIVVLQFPEGPVGAAGRVIRPVGPRAFGIAFTALGASEESRIITTLRAAEPKFIR